ncbi:hypothetical protein Tco_0664334, partial [Tanacetum coccineum]
ARQIPDKGELRDYWIGISSARDFLGTASSSTVIVSYILARCHRLFAVGRKSRALISGGQFGSERQPDATAGAHEAAEDALAVDDDMPQAVPPLPRTQGERIIRLEEEVHELVWLTRAILRHRESTKDTPGGGLARPAPPQPSRTNSSQTHDPPILIFCFYLLIKPGSKFSTIVHEYVTEPSRVFTPKSRMEKRETLEERNIDEYWWRIYKSGDLEVLES